MSAQPRDRLDRPLHDLRISVTDRCNFRCVYCMPKEVFGKDFAFLPRDQVLSFEEIERLARIFVGLGVEKLRITGGEPLVRRDLPTLSAARAAPHGRRGRRPDADDERRRAASLRRPLREAGLHRITVSLDSLDDAVFGAMNGVDFPVGGVLDGIDAAARGRSRADQGQHGDPARPQRGTRSCPWPAGPARGVILRFIEYMDVGHSNGWRMDDVVPAAEVVRRIDAELPLEPLIRTTRARSPSAGATSTGRARSA